MPKGISRDSLYKCEQAVVQKLDYDLSGQIYEVFGRKSHFKGSLPELIVWFNKNYKGHYKYFWILSSAIRIIKIK